MNRFECPYCGMIFDHFNELATHLFYKYDVDVRSIEEFNEQFKKEKPEYQLLVENENENE